MISVGTWKLKGSLNYDGIQSKQTTVTACEKVFLVSHLAPAGYYLGSALEQRYI